MNTYRARCGWPTRSFLSQADADAYDEGWNAGVSLDMNKMHGPYAQGWYDADQDQQDRDDAKVERYLRETEE